MPSSATITSFYSFTANTKARASHLVANFDLFRGHLIPIDPNTATASNNTYDLGSDEHRWRNIYLKEINVTTSADAFHIARSGVSGSNQYYDTTAAVNLDGLTLTISVVKNRPLRIEFMTPPTELIGVGNTYCGYLLSVMGTRAAGPSSKSHLLSIKFNDVTIGTWTMTVSMYHTLGTYKPFLASAFQFVYVPNTSENAVISFDFRSLINLTSTDFLLVNNIVSQASQY